MGRTWVLDTDTKGTGAEMVPLERALRDKTRKRDGERRTRARRKPASEPEQPDRHEDTGPRGPLTFKVVNAISRAVLGEGIGARETVDLLDEVRSVADVHIYVRESETDDWRALTLREQMTMWEFRGR
jgi:hypothetical protein